MKKGSRTSVKTSVKILTLLETPSGAGVKTDRAAHIIPDGEAQGEPIVSNGISLCKLHHAAFDKYFLGLRPDYVIEVRRDILEEEDGPMLPHRLLRSPACFRDSRHGGVYAAGRIRLSIDVLEALRKTLVAIRVLRGWDSLGDEKW